MSGEISLDKLAQDIQHNRVSNGDQIFLDFLAYAGTTLEELRDAQKHEDLVARCEGASNDITDEIFQFWSQNEALSVKIELAQGRAGDPAPFNSGLIAKIRVENQNHRVTVPLSERSAGFIWFFSFLAQFKQLKKTAGKAILLLDEPGLTLHGKAQADLLRYIEERLLPDHQVLYSTHSPFMVPSERLADVRVVEDVVTADAKGRKEVKGTKVSADVLSVDRETLFPLQANLGYEITQSLFIGKNTLLVEGPSDVLYLQILSQALRGRGRTGLDPAWVLCPTGGLDKVWSFASLFGGNRLNVAVLADYGAGDKAKIQRLKESEILKAGRVLVIADYTGKPESDIEDLFEPAFYFELVNDAFGLTGVDQINTALIERTGATTVRLVKQVEAAFQLLSPAAPEFDHYTPAAWLQRHPDRLDGDSPHVRALLDRAETLFAAINAML
jgi:predicted ATP-dependent endonuclease of OLD family